MRRKGNAYIDVTAMQGKVARMRRKGFITTQESCGCLVFLSIFPHIHSIFTNIPLPHPPISSDFLLIVGL